MSTPDQVVGRGGPENGEQQRVYPNMLLNDWVSTHLITYLHASGLYRDLETPEGIALGGEASRVQRATLTHLTHVGILERDGDRYSIGSSGIPQSFPGFDLVRQMANFQEEALEQDRDVRDRIAPSSPLFPLRTRGGQSMMLSSYAPLYENLLAVDRDPTQYGLGKRFYRRQPRNSLGSGLMMLPAAERIAAHVVNVYGQTDNLAILELGCGNASTTAAILQKFAEQGKPRPFAIATDIDPATEPTARTLFHKRGLGELLWEPADIGDVNDLTRVARRLQGKHVLILVGYILHEKRELARRALAAIGQVFGDGTLMTSEYLRQKEITNKVPLWFDTTHDMSGQELFGHRELLEFAAGYGYQQVGEVVVHTRLENQELLNGTVSFRIPKN